MDSTTADLVKKLRKLRSEMHNLEQVHDFLLERLTDPVEGSNSEVWLAQLESVRAGLEILGQRFSGLYVSIYEDLCRRYPVPSRGAGWPMTRPGDSIIPAEVPEGPWPGQ